jgi:hypothetical protein
MTGAGRLRRAEELVARLRAEGRDLDPGRRAKLDRLRASARAEEGSSAPVSTKTTSLPTGDVLEDAGTVRIFSRLLNSELWVVEDEQAAADLHREGVTLPVILADEAKILADMTEADARALLEMLAKIQRTFPSSRLRKIIRGPLDA